MFSQTMQNLHNYSLFGDIEQRFTAISAFLSSYKSKKQTKLWPKNFKILLFYPVFLLKTYYNRNNILYLICARHCLKSLKYLVDIK